MRFPGATGAFALFGEVLLVGPARSPSAASCWSPCPAALAAGIRHLRRYLNAEASPQRQFWRDYLKALPGGLVVGGAALVLVLVLVLDIVGMAQLNFAKEDFGAARRFFNRYASKTASLSAEDLSLAVRIETQLGDRNAVASYSMKLRSVYPDSKEARALSR